MRKMNLTDSQIERVKQVYETGEKSISALAEELGLSSRTPIKRIAKELGLDKTVTRNSNSGIKTVWTEEMIQQIKEGYNSPYITVSEIASKLGISDDTVHKKANELGLKKVPKLKITVEQETIIKFLTEGKSVAEISKELEISAWTVNNRLKALNITAPNMANNNKINVTEEFIKDIANPRYSGFDLAKKYNVSSSTIYVWRNKYFGKFKTQLHSTARFSELEYQVKDLLEELDYAYIPQKKIDKWTVDFYLGHKGVIEVNGVFHDRPKTKLKDIRKMKDLKAKGYKILVIHHSEFENLEMIKTNISEFGVSLHSNVYKKN